MKTVTIYVRCRPKEPNQKCNYIEIDIENGSVAVSEEDRREFFYDRVFGPDSTQEDIFNVIGKPHVDRLFDGINGTIFAYGQTGSGKTFTITGGLGAYAQRGLIPRILSYLFSPRVSLLNCKVNVCFTQLIKLFTFWPDPRLIPGNI